MSVESLAPPTGEKKSPQQPTDIMSALADKLTKSKEKAAETTPPAANAEPAQAEAPKEQKPEVVPPTNGQSEKPKEDASATPPESPKEDNWTDDMGFGAKAEQEQVVKEDKKSVDISAYEKRIKELEEENSDTFIAAYKEAKKNGKTVSSFINEVKGVDVDALTPDQLWEQNLKSEGLSVDDIAFEMEKFKELSPFEKKQKTKTFKEELIKTQSENLKKYASDAQKTAVEKEKLAKMAEEQGKQFFDKIKDKEWQGMKMTNSEISKLQEFLEKDFKFQNADGSINFELFAKVGNYALNERTILQNVYKRGETKGYEKALLEYSRPSANDKKFNSPPVTNSNNKSDEARKAAKSAWGN